MSQRRPEDPRSTGRPTRSARPGPAAKKTAAPKGAAKTSAAKTSAAKKASAKKTSAPPPATKAAAKVRRSQAITAGRLTTLSRIAAANRP